MRIAIPVWNGQISPVLDTAQRLCIYEVSERLPILREEIGIIAGETNLAEFIATRADAIICGALSHQIEQHLVALGVTVHPWVMGETGLIIDSYASGNIHKWEFSMPGCRGIGHGRHGKRMRCRAPRSMPGETRK